MIRQAIKTSYHCDSRGWGYIFAKSDGLSKKVGWEDSLETGANHRRAAKLLSEELDWKWESFATGCVGNDYVHVEIV